VILGVGVDVVEIARIEQAIIQRPRFLDRVFTPGEQEIVRIPQEAAGRWAAKEAIIKCVGYRLPWKEMEILKDRYGKPLARILPDIGRGALQIHVSITHDAGLAIAFAVMEGVAPERSPELLT
jgi:holo-[acyl-carrier protein] synthase